MIAAGTLHGMHPTVHRIGNSDQDSQHNKVARKPTHSIQMPESLQTNTIKSSKATEQLHPDMHRAGTPNYLVGKHVSFVRILHFSSVPRAL